MGGACTRPNLNEVADLPDATTSILPSSSLNAAPSRGRTRTALVGDMSRRQRDDSSNSREPSYQHQPHQQQQQQQRARSQTNTRRNTAVGVGGGPMILPQLQASSPSFTLPSSSSSASVTMHHHHSSASLPPPTTTILSDLLSCFPTLPPPITSDFARFFLPVHYPAGSIIFGPGEVAETLFVVRQGVVEVRAERMWEAKCSGDVPMNKQPPDKSSSIIHITTAASTPPRDASPSNSVSVSAQQSPRHSPGVMILSPKHSPITSPNSSCAGTPVHASGGGSAAKKRFFATTSSSPTLEPSSSGQIPPIIIPGPTRVNTATMTTQANVKETSTFHTVKETSTFHTVKETSTFHHTTAGSGGNGGSPTTANRCITMNDGLASTSMTNPTSPLVDPTLLVQQQAQPHHSPHSSITIATSSSNSASATTTTRKRMSMNSLISNGAGFEAVDERRGRRKTQTMQQKLLAAQQWKEGGYNSEGKIAVTIEQHDSTSGGTIIPASTSPVASTSPLTTPSSPSAINASHATTASLSIIPILPPSPRRKSTVDFGARGSLVSAAASLMNLTTTTSPTAGGGAGATRNSISTRGSISGLPRRRQSLETPLVRTPIMTQQQLIPLQGGTTAKRASRLLVRGDVASSNGVEMSDFSPAAVMVNPSSFNTHATTTAASTIYSHTLPLMLKTRLTIFGQESLRSHQQLRVTWSIAQTDCILLQINVEDFKTFLEGYEDEEEVAAVVVNQTPVVTDSPKSVVGTTGTSEQKDEGAVSKPVETTPLVTSVSPPPTAVAALTTTTTINISPRTLQPSSSIPILPPIGKSPKASDDTTSTVGVTKESGEPPAGAAAAVAISIPLELPPIVLPGTIDSTENTSPITIISPQEEVSPTLSIELEAPPSQQQQQQQPQQQPISPPLVSVSPPPTASPPPTPSHPSSSASAIRSLIISSLGHTIDSVLEQHLDLSHAKIALLSSLFNFVHLDQGEVLMREGEFGSFIPVMDKSNHSNGSSRSSSPTFQLTRNPYQPSNNLYFLLSGTLSCTIRGGSDAPVKVHKVFDANAPIQGKGKAGGVGGVSERRQIIVSNNGSTTQRSPSPVPPPHSRHLAPASSTSSLGIMSERRALSPDSNNSLSVGTGGGAKGSGGGGRNIGISSARGLRLDIPKIVAAGGAGSGKNSLLGVTSPDSITSPEIAAATGNVSSTGSSSPGTPTPLTPTPLTPGFLTPSPLSTYSSTASAHTAAMPAPRPPINPGFIGELGLILDIPRTSTIISTTDCVLLELQQDRFRNFLQLVPEILLLFQKRLTSAYHIHILHLLSQSLITRSFVDYCRAEHSLENYHAWFTCVRYRREFTKYILNGQYNRTSAEDILEKYILPSSETQVNLSGAVVQEIILRMKAGEIDSDLFCHAEHEILALMNSDSFARFKQSEAFQRVLSEINQQHLMENHGVGGASQPHSANHRHHGGGGHHHHTSTASKHTLTPQLLAQQVSLTSTSTSKQSGRQPLHSSDFELLRSKRRSGGPGGPSFQSSGSGPTSKVSSTTNSGLQSMIGSPAHSHHLSQPQLTMTEQNSFNVGVPSPGVPSMRHHSRSPARGSPPSPRVQQHRHSQSLVEDQSFVPNSAPLHHQPRPPLVPRTSSNSSSSASSTVGGHHPSSSLSGVNASVSSVVLQHFDSSGASASPSPSLSPITSIEFDLPHLLHQQHRPHGSISSILISPPNLPFAPPASGRVSSDPVLSQYDPASTSLQQQVHHRKHSKMGVADGGGAARGSPFSHTRTLQSLLVKSTSEPPSISPALMFLVPSTSTTTSSSPSQREMYTIEPMSPITPL